jgi:hypothetical protein
MRYSAFRTTFQPPNPAGLEVRLATLLCIAHVGISPEVIASLFLWRDSLLLTLYDRTLNRLFVNESFLHIVALTLL